jgi:hypothetical protein
MTDSEEATAPMRAVAALPSAAAAAAAAAGGGGGAALFEQDSVGSLWSLCACSPVTVSSLSSSLPPHLFVMQCLGVPEQQRTPLGEWWFRF